MLLESLLDNNKEGYFYLHQNVGLSICRTAVRFSSCPWPLKPSITTFALRKIAELARNLFRPSSVTLSATCTFAWVPLSGRQLPRQSGTEKQRQLAEETFVVFDDAQIQEGVAELQRDGSLETQTPEEIKDYINQDKVLPRHRKFHDRALKVLLEEA